MEILVEKREEFLAPGALPGTVKPRLTITSLIFASWINVSSHIAMELISSIDKIAGATCKYLISLE